jgi:regulator of sigma E protease
LLILTVVVFVHEFGHFYVARLNGVKVDTFSIGFGPELFGWNDKHGTRWRISALPLGGYVKMFGDADESSTTATTQELTPEEKKVSFRHKRVGQRAAIVFAGPAANFIFGIIAMALMFMVLGQQVAEPVVGKVMPDSAAAEAGIHDGDKLMTINEQAVERFDDVKRLVMLFGMSPLSVVLEREGASMELTVVPHMIERQNMMGDMERVPVLGVAADPDKVRFVRHSPGSALVSSIVETKNMVTSTLIGVGQMLGGTRGTDELGGPIRIAKGAGEAAKMGFASVAFYTILLSLNLGLINLFPIPVLDGGHLVFFGIEAALGRPLGERAQEYGFRVGMFLVLALMVFATRNDLVSLPIWQSIKHWVF